LDVWVLVYMGRHGVLSLDFCVKWLHSRPSGSLKSGLSMDHSQSAYLWNAVSPPLAASFDDEKKNLPKKTQ
jgi:hypothetical protein